MKHTLCDWFGWFCRGGNPPPTDFVAPEISAGPLFLASVCIILVLMILSHSTPSDPDGTV